MTMEKAISFLQQHFGPGLCYPVWIVDDGEFATRKVARHHSGMPIDTTKSIGNSVVDMEERALPLECGSSVHESRRRQAQAIEEGSIQESRDACAEVALLASMRESNEKIEFDDLDDVIARIVRKRDDLIQEKIQAEEEIKRLRLENQNLKNLNSISRRITNAQRDELAKLKLSALRDKEKIEELEKALHIFRMRADDVKNVLDDNFLRGFGECH